MGFLDDILSQQSGGGLLGGLPASWQYVNPESLSPVEKQMMAMVGTQNPDKAGFAPLPVTGAGNFPTNGTAPITGTNDGLPAATIGAPPPAPLTVFDTGAAPIFANPAGATPGNPMLPPPAQAPAIANTEKQAPAAPLAIGDYQMPRVGAAEAFATDPAAIPANAQFTEGRRLAPPSAAPVAAPGSEPGFMTGYQNFKHGGGLIGSIVAGITGKRNDAAGVAQQQQTQIANLTARALVNKGVAPEVAIAAVQPGNTEMLKQLVTQAFGPAQIDNLGSGYIRDRNSGKITRAYEPDEKPPTSLGDGYIWNPEKRQVERAYTPESKTVKMEDEIAARENALRARGIDPKDPKHQQYVLTGKYPREDAQPLSAADKKAIMTAEDDNALLVGTLDTLRRAKELNNKTFTGTTAGARGWLGTAVPGANIVLDEDAAKATREFGQLMSGEAIKSMSETLKGATTDREMGRFLEMLADPSTPPDIRERTINRMIQLAERQQKINDSRITDLRGGTYYKPNQTGATPTAPTAGTNYTWTPDKGLSEAK